MTEKESELITPKEGWDIDADKLTELAIRYQEGEEVEVLSAEFDIPKSTIYHYMKGIGIKRPKGKTPGKGVGRIPTPEKVIVKREAEELAEEARKIATIALGIGGPIARRYTPLLDRLMQEGKSLDYIAEEIMTWFEMKPSTQAELDKLNAYITQQDDELSLAYGLAHPNFRYALRVAVLKKYAYEILKLKVAGVKIRPRQLIKAFQTDLENLEADLKERLEVTVLE